MASLDDARVQLEGGLERLEAWAEDFAPIAADLASRDWRSWLGAHRHRWDRAIANERALAPVLAKAEALAAQSAPLRKWLDRWRAARASVFAQGAKLGIKTDGFADLFVGLTALPVPPTVLYDDRTLKGAWGFMFLFDPLGGGRLGNVAVTSEGIYVGNQRVAIASLAVVAMGPDGTFTLRLSNGQELAGRVDPSDALEFTKALSRLGVRWTRD